MRHVPFRRNPLNQTVSIAHGWYYLKIIWKIVTGIDENPDSVVGDKGFSANLPFNILIYNASSNDSDSSQSLSQPIYKK